MSRTEKSYSQQVIPHIMVQMSYLRTRNNMKSIVNRLADLAAIQFHSEKLEPYSETKKECDYNLET